MHRFMSPTGLVARRWSCAGSALAAALLIAAPASAEVFFIDFEDDAPGPVGNGFVSIGSPLLSFSDSAGSDLLLGTFGVESFGQGLMVSDSPDASVLLMEFAVTVDSLSLFFGNDDPNLVSAGDLAVLTVFMNGVFVGETLVEMNGDDVMNQSIAFGGAQFNSATIDFYFGLEGAHEVIDNITFNTIPGPGALALLVMAAVAGRKRRR